MLIYTEIFNPTLLHIPAPIVDYSKSTHSANYYFTAINIFIHILFFFLRMILKESKHVGVLKF